MPTATSNSFTVPAAGSFPSWYPAVNEVVNLSAQTTNTMQSIGWGGIYSIGGVFAFSGMPGVGYIGGQPYYIYFGGGHNNGDYNGVIACGPLTSDSLSFSEVVAPTPTGSQSECSSVYGDGKPAAPHTYGLVKCVGSELWVTYLVAIFCRTNGALGTGTPFVADLDAGTWTRKSGDTSTRNVESGSAVVTDVGGDPEYLIQFDDRGSILRFDIAADSWSGSGSYTQPGWASNIGPIARFDPVNRKVLMAKCDSSGFYASCITDDTGSNLNNGLNGPPGGLGNRWGFDYDTQLGGFVFPAPSGNQLWLAQINGSNDLDWSTINLSNNLGYTGGGPSGSGWYTSFSYCPELKGFFYHDQNADNVFGLDDNYLYFVRTA